MEQGFLSQGENIESDLMQALRIQVIPPVKHERRFDHFIMYPLEIKLPVFLPLGDQGNGMGSLAGLVCVFHEFHVALHPTQILSGIFEGFWIMNPNPRLLLQEFLAKWNGRRVPGISGISLECKPEDGHSLTRQSVELLFQNVLEKTLGLPFIDPDYTFPVITHLRQAIVFAKVRQVKDVLAKA